MKLQRTTLILILLALGLSGFVYFYEIQGAQQRETAKAKEGQIFSFEEEQIQSFTITTLQQTLKVERVNQKLGKDSPLSQWQMKAPIDTPASDASVSYLLNLLVKGKSDRAFPTLANQLQEYGLDNPQATVDVKLKNQQNHRLILGKRDYNGNFLYAQADPTDNKTQQRQVLLVPVSFEYAVKRPLSEWKAASSSPSATPSNNPTPSKSGQATPAPSATPSNNPTPSKSDKAAPSPSATPSNKPAPSKSDKAAPSPSPSS